MCMSDRVPWFSDASKLQARVFGVRRRGLIFVLLAVALVVTARALQLDFYWRRGMLNPDCLIHVRDWFCVFVAATLAVIAWFMLRPHPRPVAQGMEQDVWGQRFFLPELREYYRSHPARLRFLKRAIRRNNLNRVRALVLRGAPLGERSEYLSALELAELYGNEAIIDALRNGRSPHT